MWNPWKARREHEIRMAQLHAENQRFMLEALTRMAEQQANSLTKVGEMVERISEAQLKSANVLQTWLEGFKVAEAPESSTIRDEDEVRAAVERAIYADNPSLMPAMPDNLPPELQLAWQLKESFSS